MSIITNNIILNTSETSEIKYVERRIVRSEMLTLNTNQVLLIDAPGENKVISSYALILEYDFINANYSGSITPSIVYSGLTTTIHTGTFTNILQRVEDSIYFIKGTNLTLQTGINRAIMVRCNGNPTPNGNPSSELIVKLWYRIISAV